MKRTLSFNSGNFGQNSQNALVSLLGSRSTQLTPFHEGTTLRKQEKKYKYANGWGSNQAYRQLLDNLDYWRTLRCTKHGTLYRCPEGHGHVFDPNCCNNRRVCLICGNGYTQSKAKSTMRLFNSLSTVLRDLHIVKIVFTLPKSVQRLLDYSNMGRFRKVVNKTVYRYYGKQVPAGFMTNHPWSSKNPLNELHIHQHTFWLNYCFNKKTGEFVKVDHYMDIERLRSIYHSELIKEFKEAVVPKNLSNPDCAYHELTDEERPKIYNSLEYALRTPQTDIVAYANKHDITEFTSDQTNRVLFLLLPPKHYRRTQWFGWLADGVRSTYMSKINAQVTPEERDTRILCPVCLTECDFVDHTSVENMKSDDIKPMYPFDPNGEVVIIP